MKKSLFVALLALVSLTAFSQTENPDSNLIDPKSVSEPTTDYDTPVGIDTTPVALLILTSFADQKYDWLSGFALTPYYLTGRKFVYYGKTSLYNLNFKPVNTQFVLEIKPLFGGTIKNETMVPLQQLAPEKRE